MSKVHSDKNKAKCEGNIRHPVFSKSSQTPLIMWESWTETKSLNKSVFFINLSV